MYDVIIVGGGPAGLHCASNLKKVYGLSVGILEEHNEIGLPVQCSGLISWNLEDFVDVDENYIERILHRADIYSPSGHVLRLEKKKPVYVIDRHKFDKSLAEGLNNEIIFGARADSVRYERGCVVVNTDKGEFRGKIVVGADGPNSVVGKYFNSRPNVITGLIAVTDEKPIQDHADLFFDRKKTENFLWKIPRKGSMEYGMMGKNCKAYELKKFFGLGECRIGGGLVPIKPAPRTYFDRCILLGDAAGQTKPWSGGGIVYSLLCSEMAAKVIVNAFERNDFSSAFLKRYETLWKRGIGMQIRLGILWNSFLQRTNNYGLDLFFHSGRIIPWNPIDMDFIV